MNPWKIIEYGLELPYRLPQTTVGQRIARCILFPFVLLFGMIIMVAAIPFAIGYALYLYIKNGEDKNDRFFPY